MFSCGDQRFLEQEAHVLILASMPNTNLISDNKQTLNLVRFKTITGHHLFNYKQTVLHKKHHIKIHTYLEQVKRIQIRQREWDGERGDLYNPNLMHHQQQQQPQPLPGDSLDCYFLVDSPSDLHSNKIQSNKSPLISKVTYACGLWSYPSRADLIRGLHYIIF